MQEQVKLSAYFEPASVAEINAVLQANGVRHLCGTLMPGRCGSTLLAGLARAVGFGTGGEVFNELPESSYRAAISSRSMKDFLDHILNIHAKDGVFYFQATPSRMVDLLKICPLHMSNVRLNYTFLFRRNVVAQAISFATAIETGLWHRASMPEAETQGTPPPPAGLAHPIDQWITTILDAEIVADALFERTATGPLPLLYYEELAAAGLETFFHFLSLSGAPCDMERLEQAFDSSSLPERLGSAGYATRYLTTVHQRPGLLALLAERSATGYSKSSNEVFLREFQPRAIVENASVAAAAT